MILNNFAKPITLVCAITTFVFLQGCVNPQQPVAQKPVFTAEQARKNRLAIQALEKADEDAAYERSKREVELDAKRANSDAKRIGARKPTQINVIK